MDIEDNDDELEVKNEVKTVEKQNIVDDEIDDIQIEGDSTIWKVLTKVWSEEDEWCDTTMAMQLPNGVLIRTQYITDDQSSEALEFLSGLKLEKNENDQWFIK